ncbi:MAG: hypothetical protein K5634_06680 [Sphaerochaetaceae bacterium]|nr:hypothetical protein [Sphaerochaetaceae bacterium]
MDRIIIYMLRTILNICQRIVEELNRKTDKYPNQGLYVFGRDKNVYFHENIVINGKVKKKYISSKNENYLRICVNGEYYRKLKEVMELITQIISQAHKKVCAETGGKSVRESINPWKARYLPSEYSLFSVSNYWKQTNAKRADRRIYPFLTAKGDYVRSKSEMIIANILFALGIPYVYEARIEINGITFRPDFKILNCMTGEIIYLEHFGMMDNPEYAAKAVRKINAYYMAGLSEQKNLIFTFETKDNPLTPEIVKEKVLSFMNTIPVKAQPEG